MTGGKRAWHGKYIFVRIQLKNTMPGNTSRWLGGGIAWYGKENHTSDKSICEKYSWWMLAGGWWGGMVGGMEW